MCLSDVLLPPQNPKRVWRSDGNRCPQRSETTRSNISFTCTMTLRNIVVSVPVYVRVFLSHPAVVRRGSDRDSGCAVARLGFRILGSVRFRLLLLLLLG